MKVRKIKDYKTSVCYDIEGKSEEKLDLPSSNVIAYEFDDLSSIIVRPSGTEPKIKLYLSSVAKTENISKEKLIMLENLGTALLGF